MALRDKLKSEKSKERYDRNFNSVETTFSQKELEEHDKEIRNKAIDEFKHKLLACEVKDELRMMIPYEYIYKVAEDMKEGV